MEEKYIEIYESKVENVLVRIKNKPNIELLAKAVIMATEAYMAKEDGKQGANQ